MIQQHILELTGIMILYFLLYAVYPSQCFGWALKRDGYSLLDRVLIYLTVSSFCFTFLGYLLLALHMMNTFTLILILLAILFVCSNAQKGWLSVLPYWKARWARWGHYSDGTSSFRLYAEQKTRNMFRGIWDLAFRHLVCHPVRTLAIAAFLAVFCYTKLYPMILNDWYGQPDMYVHLSWISKIQNGIVFPDGIYPEGMHVNILFFANLFHIDPMYVVKYWGAVNSVTLLMGVFFLLCKSFRSPFTIMLALWVIFCSGLIESGALNRMSFALPQEYAWLFMTGAACFLLHYLKTKNPHDLVFLCMSFAMTMMIHFYVTLMAAILLLCIAVFNIPGCFRWKYFWRLAVTAILSLTVACIPFISAAIFGVEWNGSINWALSVMEEEEDEEEEEDTVSYDLISTDGSGELSDEAYLIYLRDRAGTGYDTYQYERTFRVFFALGIISSVILLWLLIQKQWQLEFSAQYAFLLFGIILFGLSYMAVFDIFTLMPLDRIRLFMAVFLTCGVMIPIDAFVFAPRQDETVLNTLLSWFTQAATMGFVLWLVFGCHQVIHTGFAYQAEYNAAVRAIEQIKHTLPKNSYTIVSTTSSLYRVENSGYHYETWEFMSKMEDYTKDMELRIPTPYVFFFVEKKTLSPAKPFWFWKGFPEGIGISDELARKTGLFDSESAEDSPYDYFYGNPDNRAILNSKFYTWVTEYSKYFPKEMYVVYEDDSIIIYRFRQNVDTTANFAIPYLDQKLLEETYR